MEVSGFVVFLGPKVASSKGPSTHAHWQTLYPKEKLYYDQTVAATAGTEKVHQADGSSTALPLLRLALDGVKQAPGGRQGIMAHVEAISAAVPLWTEGDMPQLEVQTALWAIARALFLMGLESVGTGLVHISFAGADLLGHLADPRLLEARSGPTRSRRWASFLNELHPHRRGVLGLGKGGGPAGWEKTPKEAPANLVVYRLSAAIEIYNDLMVEALGDARGARWRLEAAEASTGDTEWYFMSLMSLPMWRDPAQFAVQINLSLPPRALPGGADANGDAPRYLFEAPEAKAGTAVARKAAWALSVFEGCGGAAEATVSGSVFLRDAPRSRGVLHRVCVDAVVGSAAMHRAETREAETSFQGMKSMGALLPKTDVWALGAALLSEAERQSVDEWRQPLAPGLPSKGAIDFCMLAARLAEGANTAGPAPPGTDPRLMVGHLTRVMVLVLLYGDVDLFERDEATRELLPLKPGREQAFKTDMKDVLGPLPWVGLSSRSDAMRALQSTDKPLPPALVARPGGTGLDSAGVYESRVISLKLNLAFNPIWAGMPRDSAFHPNPRLAGEALPALRRILGVTPAISAGARLDFESRDPDLDEA